jgi:hypothetical protein
VEPNPLSSLAEHLLTKKNSARFYPQCANNMNKVETVGEPPPTNDVQFLASTAQLSESRSDGVSMHRLSENARSGFIRKEAKIASIILPENLFCKEALGNACVNRLLMLY